MEKLYLNIGALKNININKIRYILSVDKYNEIKDILNIQYLFEDNNYKVLSYVIIEEFNNYYAYESLYTPETLSKRIADLTKKKRVQ